MLILYILFGYAIIAMSVTLFKRFKAKQFFSSNPALPEALTESLYYRKVAQGRTVPQVLSFLLHIGLIALPVIALSTHQINLGDPGENIGTSIVLALLTAVTVIVNGFWIYPSSLNHAVQYAYKTKKVTLLVKIQELLAWVVWGAYTFYALWLAVTL